MSLQQTLILSIIANLFVVYGSVSTAWPSVNVTYYSNECDTDEFQCGNSTECIALSDICDGISHCEDSEDEEASLCTGPYTCQFRSAKLTVTGLMESSNSRLQEEGVRTLTEEEAIEIVKAAEGFAASGVDVQDNLTLMSLLLMNVVIAIFIIIGLASYHNKKQFQYIDISYIIIIIIILQHILISSINLFRSYPLSCTINLKPTGTPLDVLQYLLSMILCLLWVKYFYNRKRSKKCCAVYVIILTLLIPVALAFAGPISLAIVRFGGGWMVFTMSQISLCIVWLLLLMQDANKLNGGCAPCVKRPCGNNVRCCQKHITWYCNGFIIFLLQIIPTVLFLIYTTNSCLMIAGLLWVNPIWITISVILLFSNARCPIIMYNVIMFVISLFGIKLGYMCWYIINVNFVVHSLLIPLYMIIMFYSVRELSEWKTDLIQMYLVAFDIVTDIIVIHYFIDAEEYIFAALSIAFIILGQIVGSFSEYCTGDKTEHFIVTTADKILAALGFSGPWFIIKSWSDRKYYLLQHKHQIWEIMFESMPAVALQIYAAITQTEGGASLAVSITVSAATITFSIWMYLVKLTRLKRESRTALEDSKADGVDLKIAVMLNEHLPEGWRKLTTIDGKIYYQNDATKQTQWTKPVAPAADALPEGWRCVLTFDGRTYYQNDTTKQTQWTKPVATTELSATITGAMNTEQFVFDKGMEKLKTSRIVPKFVREKFAEVLIHRTLFVNLYFFMISDFYLRSMSIVIFISSIPCAQGADFCVARIGIGSALFLGLLVFAFIRNKRMRIASYQSCCFISIIFGVSLLSSFYNILSSLQILKDDKFFGKSVDFKSLLFEHKIRVWISFSLNVVSICFFFLYDASRNAFIGTLMLLFFVALAINYFAITKVAQYIDSKKRYTFNLCKCKESEETKEETKKVPIVVIRNKKNEIKEEEIKTEEESAKEQQTRDEEATQEEQTNAQDEHLTEEENNDGDRKEGESNNEH